MEQKPLILIAEDDECNYCYLEVALRKEYAIARAKDGVEVVAMADELQPALVLMDIKMPNKDGLQALREIKQRHPSIPVVMQTAYSFEHDRTEALEAGADEYLVKPILVRDLQQKIGEIIMKEK